jgi:hypothetical protein
MEEERKEGKKDSCAPCELNGKEGKEKDCILFQDYLTAEEEGALSALRKLKEESRRIESKIRALEDGLKLRPEDPSKGAFPETQEGLRRELRACYEELEKLRRVWKEEEARREKANQRKMALLGYDLPL